jgi:hypothetical protein
LAGFQVIINGRFWVITEGSTQTSRLNACVTAECQSTRPAAARRHHVEYPSEPTLQRVDYYGDLPVQASANRALWLPEGTEID